MLRLPGSVVAGVLFALLCTSAGMTAACAANKSQVASSGWIITLGIEGRYVPSFEGADHNELRPYPLFDLRRAGKRRNFRSPTDGASIGVIETEQFRLGPALKVKLPRKEKDGAELAGLGDVDWTVEAGAFAEYWPLKWLRGRVELRQGIGGHRGLVSDLSADVVVPVTPKLTLSGGPRLALASGKAVDPYFGITPSQSAASGLPVFEAGGGAHSWGIGAQARYEWTPRWASHVFVEYKKLVGDAADSPLVSLRGSSDQVQVGIGLSYSFEAGGL